MVRKTRKSQSKKLSKVRLLNVSSFGIIPLITISVFIGFSIIYNNAFAESASVNASAKVLESCSVESTGSDHAATIVAGNYDQIGNDTIFNINCNDPNGYIIYAVGDSGDTEGNTNLISQTDKGDIATGLNTSGDTSNWSFKLSNPTSNLTILSDFNNNSVIPTTRTAVVKREAGTTSPTTDSFHASYSAYVSKTQPVDTYQGKVKYILFHPSTTIVTYYTINYDTNGGSPNIESQTGNTTDSTITLSSTSPTKSGYTFQGWCTEQPSGNNTTSPSCSGQTYQPNNSYTLSNGADVTFYAIWKQNGPASCNSTGLRLKDGKCWSKSDVASSVQWARASSYCSGVWHLPSQAEFNALIRAYFPQAYAYGAGGYICYFSGDASTFTNDWGATSGHWWSSTEYSSTNACFLGLGSASVGGSHVYSGDCYSKTYNYQVRCVSS